MSASRSDDDGREWIIAGLLRHGVWLASAVITAGLAIEFLHHLAWPILSDLGEFDLVKAGIALFIFLPIARVSLMLVLFLRERDYAYVAISALVLAIIGAGFLASL